MRDSFASTHPLVNLAFFVSAITLTMFIMQPVCLGITILCSAVYAVFTGGKKTVLFSLRFLLPTALLIMLINPVVNHRGVTILRYLPWGNPLTLESIAYGVASAVLLCAVVLWFSSFNKVMTSDKLVYLFGRLAPALSLVLSMSLRFIPRFIAQFREVRLAQRKIHNSGKKSLTSRFKGALRVLSIMISRAIENAVETSDSMKSRGYGLKGRTAYTLFRFHRSDAALLGAIISETLVLVFLISFGKMKFRYYPMIKGSLTDVFSILFYIVYALLLLTPIIINIGEGIRWKRLKSKI